MEMGGGDGKKKGVKVGTNHIELSTKAGGGAGRQWGGWRRRGAMTTDDHGGRDTSSLNDVVRVRGKGDRGTTIVGGITYPCVVAAGVSV
jgi:hypothetical protein